MKYFFHNVRQFGKILFSNKKKSFDADKAKKDILLLVYLSTGDIFYTVANNGLPYWYFFVSTEFHLDVAQYVMESNGVFPMKHVSDYYCGDKVVLRVPQFAINHNKNTRDFIDNLMVLNKTGVDKNMAVQYLETVKQQMYQKYR